MALWSKTDFAHSLGKSPQGYLDTRIASKYPCGLLLKSCVKSIFNHIQGVPKIVPSLCGCCGEAVDSIILLFAQFYRSGFNLEFDALLESV